MYTYRPEFFRRGDRLLTGRLEGVKRQILSSANQIRDSVDKQERLLVNTNALVTRDYQKLETYLAPTPEPTGHWLPIMRILIQAQAIALDATPEDKPKSRGVKSGAPVDSKNDAALLSLSRSQAATQTMLSLNQQPRLQERLKTVFRAFESVVPQYRTVRWWEMQQLAAEISILPPPEQAGPQANH